MRVSKGNIISISVVAGVIILIGVVALNAFSPVNSNSLVFAPTTNIFLKAVKSPQGYHYSSQSTKGGKAVPTTAGTSPSIKVSKGNLVQIHLINEEKNEQGLPSNHNLNIDEFNVHMQDLGYFQTASITFLADKTGTFDYYCSIHKDMKGTITVTE
ncbi:MAG: cupredoxin domain-containing protein [Nitrosopumilus sp.]